MKFSILGAGGWGTAFARLLAQAGHDTVLWARDPRQAKSIRDTLRNAKYLPEVTLPANHLEMTSDLERAVHHGVLVLAVPSFGVGDLLDRIAPLKPSEPIAINLAKGLDRETKRTMSELAEAALPGVNAFALSGPSHAEEVGADMPTAVVLAGRDLELGTQLQREIATSRFRVYLSDDLRGVELCATIKNVIALATGISDGLGYGDNSRGALITRGLAEMVRFGRTFDVKDATFFGLSGLGDLVATCTSEHSRNRYVGCRLGRGEPIEQILEGMDMVAEGVHATAIVRQIAAERGIDMPITEAVYRLLRGEADPLPLVDEIMTRTPKREGP